MTLLAGISFKEKLTVIILCICIVVFMLVNVYLVISLHLRNKKLNGEKQEKSSDADGKDIENTQHNI